MNENNKPSYQQQIDALRDKLVSERGTDGVNVPPALLMGDAKVNAVVERHTDEAKQATLSIDALLEVVQQAKKDAQEKLAATTEQGKAVVATQQANDEKRQGFWGAGKWFGEKKRQTAEDQQQSKLRNMAEDSDAADRAEKKAEADKAAAEVNAQHNRDIARANAITTDLEGDVHGGMTRTSSEMTTWLNHQDMVAKLAKEGYLGNKPEDTKYLPNAGLYNDIIADLAFKFPDGEYPLNARQSAEKKTLNVMPFMEQALKFAAENGLEVSERALMKAFGEGARITDCVSGPDVSNAFNFVVEKKATTRDRVGWSNVGYYEMGAFQLDRFFRNNKKIVGMNKIPYILMYAAGALANGAPMHMADHLRNWLNDSIPAKGMDVVFKDEKWEPKQDEEPKELGLGYLATSFDRNQITDQTYRQKTNKPGMVEVAQKSADLVNDALQALRDRRRYDIERNFLSGVNYGRDANGKIMFPVPTYDAQAR